MSRADAIQIGGDHYKDGGRMQHWNMVVLLGWGWEYYIGNATKYATRYMKKNGAQDVEKAIHYTEKLIELVETEVVPDTFRTTQGFRLNLDPTPGRYVRSVDAESLVDEYCAANDVTNVHAYEAIDALFRARTEADLADALDSLRALHNDVLGIAPPAPPAEPTVAELATAKAKAAASILGAEAGPNYVNQDGPIIGDNHNA